jgi:hypothetical protein
VEQANKTPSEFSGGQDEVGEVLEDPLILEGMTDDSQKLHVGTMLALPPGKANLRILEAGQRPIAHQRKKALEGNVFSFE